MRKSFSRRFTFILMLTVPSLFITLILKVDSRKAMAQNIHTAVGWHEKASHIVEVPLGIAWEKDVRLTQDSANSSSPKIATDSRDSIHTVWYDNRDGNFEIYYKRSPDGGDSWEEDARLTEDGADSFSPSIAIDLRDNIHVVWLDTRDGKNDMYYKRYLSAGNIWEADVRLTDDSVDPFFPSVATDKRSGIHVVWHDNRDGGTGIYYQRSLDGGNSWEKAVPLTVENSNSRFAAIATDANYGVHVVWFDYRDGNFEIYYKRSPDGGDSWEKDVRLTEDNAGSLSPSIAIDLRDNIHVVWHDTRDGKDEIYYIRSLDTGDSWEESVRLTEDSFYSYFPSIATDKEKGIHVVWHDAFGTSVRYKRSLSAGDSWEEDVVLSEGLQPGLSRIAIDQERRIHVVWQDYRDYTWEVYYKRGIQGIY